MTEQAALLRALKVMQEASAQFLQLKCSIHIVLNHQPPDKMRNFSIENVLWYSIDLEQEDTLISRLNIKHDYNNRSQYSFEYARCDLIAQSRSQG